MHGPSCEAADGHEPGGAPASTASEFVLGDLYCRDPASGDGAGRYLRIAWPHVLPDPAALLSVYYTGAGADLVAASSPALAVFAATGTWREPDILEPLNHRGLINYVPAPGSRFTGVKRLLPDQRIDLATGRIEHRARPVTPFGSIEAAGTAMQEELCRFAEELKTRIPGRVFLPLTAGIDSRTVAAAFLATGLPFEAVTIRFPGKPESDIAVAAAISRRFGLRHHVIELEPLVPARGRAVAEHIGGACEDWDTTHLFPGNAYRYQKPGDAMIVAGCFEISHDYNHATLLGGIDFETVTGAELWRHGLGDPASTTFAGFLDDWLAWRRAHPTGLDWVVQFYLDQRLAAWRAGLEHGYDLLPAVALHPANNARIVAALLTQNPAEQTAHALQRETIRRLIPALMDFPVNPVSLADRGRHARWRLRRSLVGQVRGILGPEALLSIKHLFKRTTS